MNTKECIDLLYQIKYNISFEFCHSIIDFCKKQGIPHVKLYRVNQEYKIVEKVTTGISYYPSERESMYNELVNIRSDMNRLGYYSLKAYCKDHNIDYSRIASRNRRLKVISLKRYAHNKTTKETQAKIISELVHIKDLIETDQVHSLMDYCKQNNLQYGTYYLWNKKYPVLDLSKPKHSPLSNHIKGKIREDDIPRIKQMYDSGCTQRVIAEAYDVKTSYICVLFKRYGIKARDKREQAKLLWSNEYKAKQKPILQERFTKVYLNRRKTGTKPERDFKEWCDKHNIRVIEQYRKVGNKHPYDFFLRDYNLLVEIDGTYWHSKPEQIVKDKQQVADAIAKRYNIVRIDTTELKRHKNDYMFWLRPYIGELDCD